MNQIWKYMMVALAGLSLLACNKEENLPENEKTPSVEQYTYTIAIAGDTKSYLNGDHMVWRADDEIGWFTDQAGHSAINMGADPRSFQISSTAPMAAGAKVYAYAPYKAGEQSSTAAPLSIPSAQDGIISDAMPMVSLPIELSSPMAAATDTPAGQASFINLGAIVEYNVYTTNASYNAEKVQSVKFAATSSIAGDFSVNLTTVAENAIPVPSGLTGDTVTSTLASATTVGGNKATGIKVYQVIAPGTWSGTVTVTTDAAVYEYPVTSKEFNRATIKTLNVDLASANATRISLVEYMLTAHQWELKEVQEAGVIRTSATGNKLTLNSNHTMAFDCSANSNQTYDHTWVGGLIAPNAYGEVADMGWSTTSSGGKDYLTVTKGFLLVFAQESMTGEYEIKELTDSKLRVEITTYGEAWTLKFDAVNDSPTPTPSLACPYWHDFANGNWGIGPVFDWGGWEDGYYYSMLTNPDVLSGATWSFINIGGDYFEWAGTEGWRKGIQVGTGGMTVSFKLSTTSFPGAISKVTLGYNSGITDGASLVVSCTVGGASFGSPVAHGEGEYEAIFTGSASGEIEISVISTTNGAVYLYYVAVEYDPDSPS